ncbi:MAG: beta-CASP ribonuclease aCPSF1 [Nanoarchaeota archaeon]|nr:beta-CASP ribonuclease aCPSF1 [Nanoarchaeota archaeon]
MANILRELQERLPADAAITEVKFEGSQIILYTKNKDFFATCEPVIKGIVRQLKKRVEVRPDISITVDAEQTKKIIKELVPEEAGIKEIYFEPELGKVVIEATKPGLIIGKGGETYRKIKTQTNWLPKIERAPALQSDIVRAVRGLLHSEIDYRKKFLNKVGQKIATALDLSDKPNEWFRISFLGSGRQVGRSCILAQTKHSNVLMDCGIWPGVDEPPYLDAPELHMDALDAVIVSHSHLDHVGYLPTLYKNGFTGPNYVTEPARDLNVLLCLDYIDVCQKNGRDPPYNKKDVERMVKHSVSLGYGEVSDIAPNLRLTMQPASHLLGSALSHLHVGDGLHNLLYTGDFKYGPTRLFDPAFTDFSRVETVIMESTYGMPQDTMPNRQDVEANFMKYVMTAMERKGKVIIPSFAVGRSQETMAILAAHSFPYPVYLDGMVYDATAIHTAYPEYLSRYLQREILHHGKNPFVSEVFHKVSPKERAGIIDSADPCVVIATSGMLIGGPAMEYLRAWSQDDKNLLLFVGYQAEGTPGRRIQKGQRELPIHESGKTRVMPIRMQIETVHGMTGHSSRTQLVNFIQRLPGRPERVILNHGEPRACASLAKDLHRLFRVETVAPRNLDVLRLR